MMEKQLEILVLDDEEIVCARLKPALEKEGYHVETFTDSRQAMQRLEESFFDIVVTDLKMAELDGMELFQRVKDKWPETKVIIISGFATVEVTRKAFQAGVRDVIAKPFKIGQLKELIKRVATEVKPPRS
jgi:DNA-binding NtrC family response regulator